jgi:hypothetical protein
MVKQYVNTVHYFTRTSLFEVAARNGSRRLVTPSWVNLTELHSTRLSVPTEEVMNHECTSWHCVLEITAGCRTTRTGSACSGRAHISAATQGETSASTWASNCGRITASFTCLVRRVLPCSWSNAEAVEWPSQQVLGFRNILRFLQCMAGDIMTHGDYKIVVVLRLIIGSTKTIWNYR